MKGRTCFRIGILGAWIVTLSACADVTGRGVYEGVRQREDSMRSPTEKATQPSQPYEEYEKNRPGKGT